jgi:Fungal specific transcription factor domain
MTEQTVAYNLVGISTRLAFSIGLNTNSAKRSYTHDDEEARRTWWLIYVQEVELSLDSGRPMSIRSCDIDVDYPLMNIVSISKSFSEASNTLCLHVHVDRYEQRRNQPFSGNFRPISCRDGKNYAQDNETGSL